MMLLVSECDNISDVYLLGTSFAITPVHPCSFNSVSGIKLFEQTGKKKNCG